MSYLIFKCDKCGTIHSTDCDDLYWEEIEKVEKGMGAQIHRIAEIIETCEKCENIMQITLHMWEYPIGTINTTDIEANGVEIIEQNCKYGNKKNEKEQQIYLPTLIFKTQVYLTAYNRLKDSTKLSIQPIFEIFDSKFLNKLQEINQLIYLNILYSENKENRENKKKFNLEELYQLYMQAKKYKSNIIPVIEDIHNFDSKKITFIGFKKFLKSFEQIVIKINYSNDKLLPDNMESMLFFNENMENFIFLIDFGKVYEYSKEKICSFFKKVIDHIQENIYAYINNFIITGSLIEVSSLNHKAYTENNNQCFIIENKLYKCYLELQKLYPNINLFYSDYTIDEKHIFKDDDIKVMSFYPSIKYTDKNGDICVFKSNNIKNFDDYKNLCSYITNLKEFNPEHCRGCQEISQCAITGGGAPASWKTNMIVHHIERFNEIINKKN